MSKQNIVTLSEFARFVGITRQSLTRYIKEKDFPVEVKEKQGKGYQIDSVKGFKWLVDQSAGKDSPMFKAQLGKTQQEELRIEIENKLKMSELYPADEVDAVLSSIFVIMRTNAEGIAGRLAGGNKVLRKKFLNEIRKTLDTIAGKIEKYIAKREGEDKADKATA